MSCANTSLPWFIEPPRAMLPGRAAKPKFEIQIETKKINRLCVFHQQLTGAENPNVGTLLIWEYSLEVVGAQHAVPLRSFRTLSQHFFSLPMKICCELFLVRLGRL